MSSISLPSGSPVPCIDAMIEARCVIAGALGVVEALRLERPESTSLAQAHARLSAAHQQPLFITQSCTGGRGEE